MLIWQWMTGTVLEWGGREEDDLGSFPLDFNAHIGLGLALLTKILIEQQKPQTCKHNKAHEE